MPISFRVQPDYADYSYNIIMLYGLQVGHSFINSVFYTAWLIFSYTKNILIINLFKTIRGIKSGLASIIAAVSSYQPIWFINLDQAAGIPVRFLSMSCGEFSATSFWINGFISNYNSVFNTYSRLRKMSWFAYPTRNKNANDSYKLWFLTRCTWPRTIFISNVSASYQPAKESLCLAVPCLGVVDTNTYTHVVSIPIPGNDDSLDCLVFYNSFISKFILLRKHYSIIAWYLDTRSTKRIFSFKDWLKKKKFKKNDKILNNKNSYKLLSGIKFRFNLLKNIQLGMNMLFINNSKYMLKNFEYLDVFKYGKRKNNKSIEKLLIRKRKLARILKNCYKYYKELKNIYFNKKLWKIHYMVRRRFFQYKYFKLNLFTQNYFKTNIKIERFYKTHVRRNSIDRNIAPKIYKFYVIYNFFKYKQLATKIYKQNIFDTVYYKLIINQLIKKNLNIDNKINYSLKKKLNFFSFKNLYNISNKEYKRILLGKFFVILNKKNWLFLSKFNRELFLTKIKFLYEVKMFKKLLKLKGLNFKYKFFNFTFLKKIKFFLKNFTKFNCIFGHKKSIVMLILENLFLTYKMYLKKNYHFRKKDNFFFNKKKKYKKIYSLKNTFNYWIKRNKKKHFSKKSVTSKKDINERINFLKINFIIKYFLYRLKKKISNIEWVKLKYVFYKFIKIYTKNNSFQFFYSNHYIFYKNFFIKIFYKKFLPLIFLSSKNKIKNNKNKYEKKKIKLFKNHIKFFFTILFKVIKKNKIDKIVLNYKKKKRMISLKKIEEKKKKIEKKNIIKYKKSKNKFFLKRNVLYKNNYSLYKDNIKLHPFYRTIKYEYLLYLKKNPYNNNSTYYWNYIYFNNFIKWRRKNFLKNLSWYVFKKYTSSNKNDFYKDLFSRYKMIYTTKFIYKNVANNLLFTTLKLNSFSNKTKYHLGWFIFKNSLKVKDWFYQKDFFLFPTWFYNYKKKIQKNYFFKNKAAWKLNKLKEEKKKKKNEIKKNKKLLILNANKYEVLNNILSNILYEKLDINKNFTALSLKYNKYIPLKLQIRNSIKNTLLSFAYILWDKTFVENVKSDYLISHLIYLNKHFSFSLKDKLLFKLKFNKKYNRKYSRKLREWKIKFDKITNCENFFFKSLNKEEGAFFIANKLLGIKYTDEQLNDKIDLKVSIWKNYKIEEKKKVKTIIEYINELEKIQKEESEKFLEKESEKVIIKKRKEKIRYYNNFMLFKKNYANKKLNNYYIGSSINNLFNRFYNVPKLNNYNDIKNYFKYFKICISNNFDLNKKKKNKKNINKTPSNVKILLHKNFINNLNINLYEYLKIYGFKWYN
jgi:ribosomal protein S2